MLASTNPREVDNARVLKQTCCLTNVNLWLDINNKVDVIESRDGEYRVRETPKHFS